MKLYLDLDKYPKDVLIEIIKHQQKAIEKNQNTADDVQHLKKSISEVFGGQKKLAVALNVSQGVVSKWVRGFEQMPSHRKRQIEKLSKGKITFK
jgi:hypothetical protein